MKHVYDWIDEEAANSGEALAKEWLRRFLRPEVDKIRDGTTKWLDDNALTVEWKGHRLLMTGASRLGDIWLKVPNSNNFYDHRVDVTELSNWQPAAKIKNGRTV